MRDPYQIRNRPAIVDTTVGRGRMLLSRSTLSTAGRPSVRSTWCFNACLYYNDLE